jgi:hypothetical protein
VDLGRDGARLVIDYKTGSVQGLRSKLKDPLEDTQLPVLLRDAQVLPIWEGTTNVLCLDALLRADFTPGAAALRARAATCTGAEDAELSAAADKAIRTIDAWLAWHAATRDPRELQAGARRLILSLGRAFELALLVELASKTPDPADRIAARRACLGFALQVSPDTKS